MINFPVFDRLDVSGYGLYPGAGNSRPGLHVQFLPGLTLVLGANGLGKTTLIRIMFRLLTGPYDIARLEGRHDLGGTSLSVTRLPLRERRTFAGRVVDGARDAKARLGFHIGQHRVSIERRLSDLTLTQLEIDDGAIALTGERTYQNKIVELSGTSSIGDWMLLLRFLIFYFEDRRALVWDPSAQRQILRMLLLPASESRAWTEDERDILELDSRMRNLNAALGREERALAQNEAKAVAEGDIRSELEELAGRQEADTELHERLDDELQEADSTRRQARLRLLKAEQEREARFRGVERAKLAAIETQFPSRSETARYILAQLLSDEVCIVCGSRVPQAAAEYARRIELEQCVICGSDISAAGVRQGPEGAEPDSLVRQAASPLARFEAELAEARLALDEAEASYEAIAAQITEVANRRLDCSRRAELLVRQLPPEEAEMLKQRSQLTLMRAHVEDLRAELAIKRRLFAQYVARENRDIAKSKDAIKAAFDQYAEGFLLEQCRLTWSPRRAKIGQTGRSMEFPAFELDMTGADFAGPVRRNGPEEVSESQREFIDLAFRIALMSVASAGGSSLVMDAPESSLDVVFAPRAAGVFSRFAEAEPGNCLIITSNLVEGQLIPSLIGSIPEEGRAARVVDLVDIAAPTAAVRERRSEYRSILRRLLAGSDMKDTESSEEHQA